MATRPGHEDDYEGKAFLGKEGTRIRDFYFAQNPPKGFAWLDNLIACAPPKRAPKADEIAACRPRVMEIINVLDPDLILAMGKDAVVALTGCRDEIAVSRGKFHKAVIPGRHEEYVVPVFATFHPGQFVYSPDKSTHGIEKTWEKDFIKAIKVATTLKEIRERTT